MFQFPSRKISQADEMAIRQGVRVVLERQHQAWLRFVASVEKWGGKGVDAAAVADFYVKEKLAKFDGMDFKVKHGALLDRDVLLRASAMAAEKAAKRHARKPRQAG